MNEDFYVLVVCLCSFFTRVDQDTIKSTSISNKKNPSFSAFLVSIVNILALTLKAPNSVYASVPAVNITFKRL